MADDEYKRMVDDVGQHPIYEHLNIVERSHKEMRKHVDEIMKRLPKDDEENRKAAQEEVAKVQRPQDEYSRGGASPLGGKAK